MPCDWESGGVFGVTGRATACPASTPSEYLVAWEDPVSPTRALIDSRARSAAASLQTARVPKASGHQDLFRTQGGERSGLSDRATRGRRATTDGELRRRAGWRPPVPGAAFSVGPVPKGTTKEKGPRTAAVVCGVGPTTHSSAGDSADQCVGPVIGGSGHPLSNVEDEVPETGHGRGAGGSKKARRRRVRLAARVQLALQQIQFWGVEALRPASQENNAKSNTHRDPGRLGGWLSRRASQTRALRPATRQPKRARDSP